MDQSAAQSVKDPVTGHFRPGNVANPHGAPTKAQRRAQRDALISAWCKPIGGPASLNAAELTLLNEAAGLVLSHPRTHEDRVRCTNLVSRILGQVGLVGGRKHESREETLAEYCARSGGAR